MFYVPQEFRSRPFHRSEALAHGITRGVLQGKQFRRVHEGVWCHADHDLTFADRVLAARLALPSAALTTGITRIQEIGIDYGPREPLHFVVEGDHHLALAGVFLHRTVKTPPSDEGGVSDEAAFVAFCAEARLIDAIKVGCEMLRIGRLDLALLDEIRTDDPWRAGVAGTTYVVPLLTHRCRSMPEAELLAYIGAAGLPEPDVNAQVEIAEGVVVTPDEWFGSFESAVEYEGAHHQADRGQYNSDIDRYAAYRRHGVAYELVTKERLRSPRSVMRTIHAMLAARGYDGPPPEFGAEWDRLFQPLRTLPRPPRIPGSGE